MDKNILFASLALEMGFLTEGQVRHGLTILNDDPDMSFSEICLDEGWITPQNLVVVESRIQLTREKYEQAEVEGRRLSEVVQKVERLQPLPTDADHPTAHEDPGNKAVHPELAAYAETSPGEEEESLVEAFSSAARVGTVVGKYHLLEEIAQGGTGIVFKARESDSRRIVAVKVMHQTDLLDEKQLERFHREIKAAEKLRHPHIVSVYDAGDVEDAHYMAMEFIDGVPLSEYSKKHVLGPVGTARLMVKIAVAVDHAHEKQLIHRDLKPSNILIDSDGEPHITDFGLAKDLSHHSHHLTRSGTTVGTPFYMAPEQVMGEREEIGPETDVYALGVILYELLTEQLPFTGETTEDVFQEILRADPVTPRSLRPNIPPDLEAICLKAVAKSPQWRYAAAKEFAEDIERFLAGKSILARPSASLIQVFRNLWPYKFYISLGSLLALCAVFAFMLMNPDEGSISKESLEKEAIAGELRNLQQLYNSEHYQKLRDTSRRLVESYPHVSQMRLYLARSLFALGSYRRARENYIHVYWSTAEKPQAIESLLGMAECSLLLREEQKALQIMETAQKKYQVDDSASFALLYGRILLHTGNFAEASQYIQRASPSSLSPRERKIADYYSAWGRLLARKREISFVADGATAIKLHDGQISALVAWNEESAHIYRFHDRGFSKMGSLLKPEGLEFTGPLVTADIYGDGEPRLIMSAKARRDGYLLFYRYLDDRFILEKKGRLSNVSIKSLTVGQVVKRGLDNIVVIDEITSAAKLLYRKSRRSVKAFPIFPEWVGKNDILSVDICNLDETPRPELLMGTGDSELYDIGVYQFQQKDLVVKMRKRLGKVEGCTAFDLDADDVLEILVIKTHTNNRGVFGEETPYGERDGFYILAPQNQLETEWKSTVDSDRKRNNFFYSLATGRVGDVPVAICRYRKREKTFAGTKEEERIWLVRSYRGEFRRFEFTWPEPILSCTVGEVDGDEKGELVICGQRGISLYGMESR